MPNHVYKASVSATVQGEGRQAPKREIELALGRVLEGHSFRSSAQCQALLRYIVERSLSHENELLRERLIGINVFGRPSDYDSGSDPIVRVRAAEIRKRLAQHYLHGEGASEEIRIEIPPGSYKALFTFHTPNEKVGKRRESGLSEGEPHDSGNQAGELREAPKGVGSPISGIGLTNSSWAKWIGGRLKRGLVAITAFGLVMAAAGFFVGHLSTTTSVRSRDVQGLPKSPTSTDDPVSAFWAPFLQQDHSPIIAYADAMFLIDGSGDLFRFRHGASDNRGVAVDQHLAHQFASNSALVTRAGPLFYDNGYTGTGDLRAMAVLITQLAHQGATPLIESSYDISTDELKQHNVIFLGSSAENLAVAQLVPAGSFLFAGPTSKEDPWSDEIVNSQPRSGELSKYATLRDPATHGVQQDYALVSFQPGVTPEHQIAILGGIDTTGTEGAALLVTSKGGVEELSSALAQVNPTPPSAKGQAFQALVRVDVKKGYQVLGSHLVTLHPLDIAKPAATTGSFSSKTYPIH